MVKKVKNLFATHTVQAVQWSRRSCVPAMGFMTAMVFMPTKIEPTIDGTTPEDLV